MLKSLCVEIKEIIDNILYFLPRDSFLCSLIVTCVDRHSLPNWQIYKNNELNEKRSTIYIDSVSITQRSLK